MADLEVQIHIDAPPETVWGLIGDPTRMGEWSPECERVVWSGGAGGAAVGARFKGHNHLGWRRWTTQGTIVTYEPERQIAWNVAAVGMAVARWDYRIIPQDGAGCTLVEGFTDRRSTLMAKVIGPVARGVRDTPAHNRSGMERTLATVKEAAEAHADRA